MKKTIFFCLIFVSACEQTPENKPVVKHKISEKIVIESRVDNRWYTPSQVKLGSEIYQKNCLQCHNKDAAGIQQWKQSLPNGDFPPPPLNGSAHAWHHDIGTLTRVIKNGGIPLGGVMPPFKNKLSDAGIRSVIAYFQSFWSDKIYRAWLENGGLE